MAIPANHPRAQSLRRRHLLEEGVRAGITTPTGLCAHGRGEAFDYLLGEKSHPFSKDACRAAAAALLLAEHPVISINGNTAVLVPDEMISLAREVNARLEINLFHDAPARRKKIAKLFRTKGASVLGIVPNARISGLASNRAKVDREGIYRADLVLVSLEDGDRTEILRRGGKKIIAVDLNPLSRTPKKAHISITDNVLRALPLIEKYARSLRRASRSRLEAIVNDFDNRRALGDAEAAIRRIPGAGSRRNRSSKKISQRPARNRSNDGR